MNVFFTCMLLAAVTLFNFISVPEIHADDKAGMRGKAFSDPLKPVTMPEDWNKKPISYVPDFMSADVVIDLNQQIDLYIEPLVREYAAKNNIKILSSKGTCGKSAGKIDRKEVDIAAFCCPPEEKDRLPGLRYHTLGITPLAFLVHPDNPVKDITLEQLRNIYRGNIGNWSEVGGPDMTIKRIASLHCKHRPGHWRLMLADEDMFTSDILLTGEMEDMIAFVASNPGAIGYETLLVADRFKHRGNVRGLKINGYDPLPENLIPLNYSMYRVFNVTTWEGADIENPHAQKLVDYLIEHMQALDKKVGILPAEEMRKSGWIFLGNEVVGEPVK